MINKNIKVGDEVPPEIRLQVYKEALENIEKSFDLGICLMLPMILWGLKSYLDRGPDGKSFNWRDTEKIFPEMKGISMAVNYTDIHKTAIDIRSEYLTEAIKKLSNEKTRSQKTV
jgi:hypothetical protein